MARRSAVSVPRARPRYVCQSCGDAFLRWEGQCRSCGAWNSLVETLVRELRPEAARRGGPASIGRSVPEPLGAALDDDLARLPIGIAELDRVLGGGLVPGSVVLIGGEPGVGKSTLLLQAAGTIAAARDARVLYATGEESTGQVRLRGRRLALLDGPAAERVSLVAETDVERICDLARSARPAILVVDSIQTVGLAELEGPPGSVGQVRESALRLVELAKSEGIATILVGHVTKDGSLAGPKTLEHLVDAVLSFEGERFAPLRIVRASKNRFGPSDEVGVFEMRDVGLVEVADPGRAFVGQHEDAAPGSVVVPALEGSRPLLVEVQALVTPGSGGPPRRTASGLDGNRLSLLVAVLGRRAGIGLASHDVYANVAGGLSLAEPAVDLPLALALASSLRDRPVAPDTVAFGEVGLLGELRPVAGFERRIREAARLGFGLVIAPRPAAAPERERLERAAAEVNLRLVAASTLREAVATALGTATVAAAVPIPTVLG